MYVKKILYELNYELISDKRKILRKEKMNSNTGQKN